MAAAEQIFLRKIPEAFSGPAGRGGDRGQAKKDVRRGLLYHKTAGKAESVLRESRFFAAAQERGGQKGSGRSKGPPCRPRTLQQVLKQV